MNWNPLIERFALRKGALGTARTLHIAGRATERARDALEDPDGFVVEESALLVSR